MSSISEYVKTSELVDMAKKACHITKPNTKMGEDDIRAVIRWIGHHSPGIHWLDGKPILGRTAIDMMLFITLTEFPLFYMWHKLSQWN
jgi:hypothetical protein